MQVIPLVDGIFIWLGIGRNQPASSRRVVGFLMRNAGVSLQQIPSRERSTAETSKRLLLSI